MLNEAQSTDKFCEYYAKWITVYKKGAIRQVTMDMKSSIKPTIYRYTRILFLLPKIVR